MMAMVAFAETSVRMLTYWLGYFNSTSISCFRNNSCSHIFQPSGRQVQVGIMFLLSRQVWESWSQTGSLTAVRCLFRWWVLPQPLHWAQGTHGMTGYFFSLYQDMVQCHLKLSILEGTNCFSFLPLSTIVSNPDTSVSSTTWDWERKDITSHGWRSLSGELEVVCNCFKWL